MPHCYSCMRDNLPSLAKLSCECPQLENGVCMDCVRTMIRLTGQLKCPTCRTVVESWEEKHTVANLKRKHPHVPAPDTWPIAYIAGIRWVGQEVEYKVVFASPEFRAGPADYEWMSAGQMDGSDNIVDFHHRYNIPPPGSLIGLQFGVAWEFELPAAAKVGGRVTYKCPHRGCRYSHEKRSNVDVHIVGVHQRCPFLACPHCAAVQLSKSNLMRHFKRCAGW